MTIANVQNMNSTPLNHKPNGALKTLHLGGNENPTTNYFGREKNSESINVVYHKNKSLSTSHCNVKLLKGMNTLLRKIGCTGNNKNSNIVYNNLNGIK